MVVPYSHPDREDGTVPAAPVAPARPALRYTDSHTRASRRTGSPEVAAQLLPLLDDSPNYFRYRSDQLPMGWRFLGSGVTRVALLGPDGFVYKVQFFLDDTANERETLFWKMALRHQQHRRFVPHFRLMEVKRYTLLAMELLEVDRARSQDRKGDIAELRRMARHIGCEDTHLGNIGWRGDTPVLLDAGNGTDKEMTPAMGCGDCNPLHPKWNPWRSED
jgi:hypothetical protein